MVGIGGYRDHEPIAYVPPVPRPWWWWLAFGAGSAWLATAAWVIYRASAGWPIP